MALNFNCSNIPLGAGLKECNPAIHREPTKEQVERYYAEYNYLHKHSILFEKVSKYLESKKIK